MCLQTVQSGMKTNQPGMCGRERGASLKALLAAVSACARASTVIGGARRHDRAVAVSARSVVCWMPSPAVARRGTGRGATRSVRCRDPVQRRY